VNKPLDIHVSDVANWQNKLRLQYTDPDKTMSTFPTYSLLRDVWLQGGIMVAVESLCPSWSKHRSSLPHYCTNTEPCDKAKQNDKYLMHNSVLSWQVILYWHWSWLNPKPFNTKLLYQPLDKLVAQVWLLFQLYLYYATILLLSKFVFILTFLS
jgi:hypothetical protein